MRHSACDKDKNQPLHTEVNDTAMKRNAGHGSKNDSTNIGSHAERTREERARIALRTDTGRDQARSSPKKLRIKRNQTGFKVSMMLRWYYVVDRMRRARSHVSFPPSALCDISRPMHARLGYIYPAPRWHTSNWKSTLFNIQATVLPRGPVLCGTTYIVQHLRLVRQSRRNGISSRNNCMS